MYNDFHPIGDLVPFRPLIQLFIFGVVLELLACTFYIVHFSMYASDGVGVPPLNIGAEVAHGMSECVLILLVILIAKGWNINSYSLCAKVCMGLTMSILYALYVSMIVEGNLHAEMPTAIYIYDTPAGIALNCLRVLFAFILIAVFSFGVVKAATDERLHMMKQDMQKLLVVIFLIVLWLLITPVCSLAVAFVAAYMRETIAVSFECIGHTYGCAMLLFVLWPSRIHEYFPVGDTDLSESIVDWNSGRGDSTSL